MKVETDPPCGQLCSKCRQFKKQCAGCSNAKGKPFWTAMLRVCPIYGCCTNNKRLEHCGLCDEFPCKTFVGLRDLEISSEQFEKSLDERKRSLIERRNKASGQQTSG